MVHIQIPMCDSNEQELQDKSDAKEIAYSVLEQLPDVTKLDRDAFAVSIMFRILFARNDHTGFISDFNAFIWDL